MWTPAAFPLVLAMVAGLAPAVQASDAHIEAADFAATAQGRLGEQVTVDNCHLVFATESEATCLGLAPASGGSASESRLLIRMTRAARPRVARALDLCEGGVLDDACHVSVSGVVDDLSGAYGIAERRMLGLREGTINWPD